MNSLCWGWVDSAVVDALQRGQWSPGDLLCSLYNSLQAFAVQSRIAAIPDCNDPSFCSSATVQRVRS